MGCRCNWVESILAIIIIIFAFVTNSYSQWIIVIAAVLLLIHALACKKCRMSEQGMMMDSSMPRSKAVKKKSTRKRSRR